MSAMKNLATELLLAGIAPIDPSEYGPPTGDPVDLSAPELAS